MKKSICLVLSFLLLFCLVGCKKVNNKIKSKEERISWSDYIPVPSANVTDVHFTKFDSSRGWIRADDNPAEATAFIIDVMCPYCKEEYCVVLDYKELPKDKLGDKTIVVKKSATCSKWAEHTEPFTGDCEAVIQLALTK